jgi:hypothetical protein
MSSDLRSLMAGAAHVSYTTLAEAARDPDGAVVFDGDDGGQIYAVARASFIRWSEAQLRNLLAELDGHGWQDPESMALHFESHPNGAVVSGGMGGGLATSEVWVHPQLQVSEAAVRAVLLGEAQSVRQ